MRKIFLIFICFALIVFIAACCSSQTDTVPPQTDIPQSDTDGHKSRAEEKLINVPNICQYPELPTGCESVAATMVLQYYGIDITPGEFVISWLEYSEKFYRVNGYLYGPDPNKVFVGNPFTKNSYGCFADPIVNAINRNSKACTAQKITDRSLPELCSEYINDCKPLLIWATMGMRESAKGNSWYLEDGSLFTWTAHEHCLVLVGYNEKFYYLNDPMTGSTAKYDKDIVEMRFKELGSQAICISLNEI